MKMAFVGAGRISHFHYDAFQAAGAQITSICTRGESGKEFSEKYGAQYFNNLETLIKEDRPEAVCLLTQPSSYPSLLPLLQQHDIPVFLEKPVSYNLNQGHEIEKLLPTKAMVGQNRRFYSNVQAIKTFLKSKKSVTAHFFVCERAKDIRIRPEYDRDNWHTLNGIHGVDLMKHLFGAPKEVLFQDHWGELDFSKLATFNTMVFNSEYGHRVQFHSNFDSPGGWRIHIFDSETEVSFFPIEQTTIKTYSGTETVTIDPKDSEYKQGFYRQAQCFIEGVQSEKRPDDWVSFSDALDSVALTEKIYNTL